MKAPLIDKMKEVSVVDQNTRLMNKNKTHCNGGLSPLPCQRFKKKETSIEPRLDRKSFRELAISSFNAQMKKRTRVASADIGISPDTVRLSPVQSFLGRGLYLSVSIKMYR